VTAQVTAASTDAAWSGVGPRTQNGGRGKTTLELAHLGASGQIARSHLDRAYSAIGAERPRSDPKESGHLL
jgi:hypothetical protein